MVRDGDECDFESKYMIRFFAKFNLRYAEKLKLQIQNGEKQRNRSIQIKESKNKEFKIRQSTLERHLLLFKKYKMEKKLKFILNILYYLQ